MSQGQDQSKAVAVYTFGGVILGGALTIAAQYLITYQGIERPKIELETKRANIEAHKHVLALSPSTSSSCHATNIDNWSWKISCTTKNAGQYPVDVTLSDIQVTLSSDTTEKRYRAESGFTINYPNDKKTYRSQPGTEGQLWAYVNFDKTRYADGIKRTDLLGIANIESATISSVQEYVAKQFPELKRLVADTSTSGANIYISLPVPVAEKKAVD